MFGSSFTSVPKQVETPDPFQGLSIKAIKQTIQDLKADIHHLELENEIFENFLVTNEPSLITGMQSILEKAIQIQVDTFGPDSMSATTGSLGSSDTTVERYSRVERAISKGPRINFTQKMDLILREIDEMQISYKKYIRKAIRMKFDMRAEMEEIEIRAAEVNEAATEFEESVAVGGIDNITQKIPAEKFLRYMQDWLKSAQAILERLRLHNISLRLQLSKLRVMKVQKETLGEFVHEVDLEKLQIENANLYRSIQQKNQNLIELKQMNSKANLLLFTNKKILEKQRQTVEELKVKIEDVKKMIEECKAEAEVTELNIEQQNSKIRELHRLSEKYTIPSVMEYIKKKAELHGLERELKILRRRSSIQEVGLQTYTRMMCHLTGIRKPRKSWYSEKIYMCPESQSEDNNREMQVEEEEEEGEKVSVFPSLDKQIKNNQ